MEVASSQIGQHAHHMKSWFLIGRGMHQGLSHATIESDLLYVYGGLGIDILSPG